MLSPLAVIAVHIPPSMYAGRNPAHHFAMAAIMTVSHTVFSTFTGYSAALAWMLPAGRRLPLPRNLQHTLFACGLRGAVAYGLAVNLPNIDAELDGGIPAIESATLVIVLVSTLLFGGITGAHDPDQAWCLSHQCCVC